MKKFIYGITFFLLGSISTLITGFAFAQSIISFPDVKSTDWYYNDVNNMVAWGVIEGNDDGTFKPGNNVNRAELSAMWNRYNNYLKTQFVSKTAASTATPPNTSGGLEILSHSLKQGTYWEINGEVQNNSSTKKDFVKISATFYDNTGKVIDSGTTYTDPATIEPGQKAPFKLVLIHAPANYDHYTVQVSD